MMIDGTRAFYPRNMNRISFLISYHLGTWVSAGKPKGPPSEKALPWKNHCLLGEQSRKSHEDFFLDFLRTLTHPSHVVALPCMSWARLN